MLHVFIYSDRQTSVGGKKQQKQTLNFNWLNVCYFNLMFKVYWILIISSFLTSVALMYFAALHIFEFWVINIYLEL